MNHPLTIWVSAICSLAVFSYLYKNNTFYRIVQHAALGTAIGMAIVLVWSSVLWPKWAQPIYQAFSRTGPPSGAFWILALVPGSLWYFQLSKKYFWVSTFVSSFFIGVAAGYGFKTQIILMLPQITASFKNLNPAAEPGGFTVANSFSCLSNLIFVGTMFATISYFFFSIKGDNPLMKAPARVGRIMIMVCLGAMFGATVMTRMAYLLERLKFFSEDWVRDQIIRGIFGG